MEAIPSEKSSADIEKLLAMTDVVDANVIHVEPALVEEKTSSSSSNSDIPKVWMTMSNTILAK